MARVCIKLGRNFQDIAKKLENAGVIEPLNVVKVGPFRLQMKSRELSLNKQHPWAFVPLAKLGKLARAMGYLVSRPRIWYKLDNII